MKKIILLCISFVLISINGFSAIGDSFSIKLHMPEGFYEPNTYYFRILSNSTVGLVEIENRSNLMYDEHFPSSVQYKGRTYRIFEICDSAYFHFGNTGQNDSFVNLTNIPNGVTRIGKFFGINSKRSYYINTLTLPSSIKEIADYAFNYNYYKKTEKEDNNKYYNIQHIYVNNPIPIEISDSTFSYKMYKNTFLHVPKESVALYKAAKGWKNFRIINDVIASEETNAELIKVSRNMGWISYNATEMTVSDAEAVRSLGGAFRQNDKLTSFNEFKYFTGVESIGDESFFECAGLTSVTIPEGLPSIGERAFSKCSQLVYVNLPRGLKSIDKGAFYECSSLQSVILPEGLTVIEESTFDKCTGLERVSVGKNITCIERYAFGWGNKMTSFSISSINPPKIYDSTFSNCKYVKLYVPMGCKELYEADPYWNRFEEIIEDRSLGKYTEKNVNYVPMSDNTLMVSETEEPLEVVDIPSSIFIDGQKCTITKIGENAFEDNTVLKQVSIPETVESIGDRAFAGCTNLSSIYVYAPKPIHLISGVKARTRAGGSLSVFEGVDTKTCVVYVPAGSADKYRMAAGWEDFLNIVEMGQTSSSLITFADPEAKRICIANWDTNGDGELSEEEAAAVNYIGQVFRNNTDIVSFEELKYFTGLKSISYHAFSHCNMLQKIVVPDNVNDIGMLAFLGCSSLNSITLPNGLKELAYGSFMNCSSLTSIIIPESVNQIDQSAFARSALKSCKIPNGVELVNYATFYDCKQLNSIELPNTIIKIDSLAFMGCEALESISIPNKVEEIGDAAFANCFALSDIIMPQTINSIGAYAFQNCKSLTRITLPSAISKISKGTFIRCSSLQNIEIPSNVTTIDSLAFMNCDQLSSISFSSKLNSINQGAFAACSKLKSITLPASLTFIGEQAFGACTSLEALIIPSKVQTIGLGIVGKCTSLTSLTVDSNNPYFYSKSNGIVDKRINMLVQSCKVTEIPTEVVGIADYGFIFVSGREEIIIPENVKSIGYDAFQDCDDLKRVTIPRAIESIGEEAFLDCESLERVTVLNPEPIAITDNVFQMQNDKYEPEGFTTATLYVPNGSKKKYQSSVGWKNFKNIVETESKTLTLMVNRCEREYGDDNPTFTYTAEGGAFTGEPEITCEATKTSPVGIYLITISRGSIDFDGKITFINANLSVTRATLTITADDKTMTAGDDMPELTVTYTGFKNNETEDVLIRKPTLRTTGSSLSSPGTYPIYVSGAYAENYLFKYVDGKLTIKKKETVYDHVIFTANSYTRQYGESNPIFTYKSEGGSYTGEPIISCDATIKSPAGTYPIYISQGSVDNNNATFIQGTLTITKAPLVVTADDKTIVQGEDIPELTISYDGFVNGEAESVLKRKPVAVTTATINSEAGEYPIIVKGGVADNYEFYYKNGILTIEAQEPITHNRTLVMHLNNGNREKFVLSEQPLFVLSNEKLIVKTSGMGAVYLRSDIKEFTFEENTDGILKAPAINEIIIRQLSNGDVSIYGLEIGAIVRVYDLNGASVYSSSPSTNEELIIPLGTRKSGIYIININNNRTIKIQKK